jgi:hypothetical protein
VKNCPIWSPCLQETKRLFSGGNNDDSMSPAPGGRRRRRRCRCFRATAVRAATRWTEAPPRSGTGPAPSRRPEANVIKRFSVKNLFILFWNFRCYLQVLSTRLIPVNKTRLLLKPSNFDMNRCVTFHSLWDKESDFNVREMRESVDDLDSFLSLPTHSCYQLTLANTLLMLSTETYHH